jgi:hypothetical protein
MRRAGVLSLLLLSLAGCADGPAALGITGPQGSTVGVQAQPPSTEDPLDNPNALQSGVRYAPSPGPTTGSGHYWGYD